MDMARLQYYAEHGTDQHSIELCKEIVNGDRQMSDDTLHRLADLLTPKINLIMNVEYQTMRKHSKVMFLFRSVIIQQRLLHGVFMIILIIIKL